MTSNKRGFTLIELLIAVMVIAVLAAVAIPQYRRSMERSRMMEFIQLAPAIHDSLNRYFAENTGSGSDNMPPLSALDFSAKGFFASEGAYLVTPNFVYAVVERSVVGRVKKGRFKGTLFIFALHPGTVNVTLPEGEAVPDWYCWEGGSPHKGACQFMGITEITSTIFNFQRAGGHTQSQLDLDGIEQALNINI